MPYKSASKVYVIVGEESGENIAYTIISELKKKKKIKLYGIGGKKLESIGVRSLFPFTDLSVMGLFEIIPKIPKLLYLINKTVNDIINVDPDLIITVDSPGFTFRVLKKLKSINPKLQNLHIVAPTVWAWKPDRAKKISYYIDNLFVLFPFEKKYFQAHGIKTTFIGHPILESLENANKNTNNLLNSRKKVVSIFPGSRKNEIKTHLKSILTFLSKNKNSRNYSFLIISVDRHLALIKKISASFANILDIQAFKSSTHKNYSFKYSSFAIAVSGTISLELALSKTPLFVVYKINMLTFLILKKLVKSKYISLANIILKKKVIPELIQDSFSLYQFNKEFNKFVGNSTYKRNQIVMFKKLKMLITPNDKNYKNIMLEKIIKLLV